MRAPGLNDLPRRDPERRSSNHTWIFFEAPLYTSQKCAIRSFAAPMGAIVDHAATMRKSKHLMLPICAIIPILRFDL
jgi:hypothetical protein